MTAEEEAIKYRKAVYENLKHLGFRKEDIREAIPVQYKPLDEKGKEFMKEFAKFLEWERREINKELKQNIKKFKEYHKEAFMGEE